VSAPDDCRQNEDFVILNTGGSAKATAQNTWYTSTSGIFGAWFPVSGSTFTATTNGGPLLIFIDVSLNGGSHATCRPVIDGVWAGTYGGLSKSPSDPFWTEGLVGVGAIGSGWQKWSKTRLYQGVPAGIHTFGVECATDGGTLTVGTTSVGASAGFVEQ
jgi:hypothetical protein